MKLLKSAVVALILYLGLALSALACSSISGPAVISTSGDYCLSASITAGIGEVPITINAANVSLDLKGRSLIGPGSGTGVGIYVPAGRHNVKIYNGSIRGFMYGIRAIDADNLSLSAIDGSYNTFRGFAVTGSGARIENSRVDFLNGHAGFADSFAMGMEVIGPDCLIRFNHVRNIRPRGIGEGVGISASSNNNGCQIYDNVIRLMGAPPPYGRTFAIWIGGSVTNVSIHNNVIIGTMYGIAGLTASSYTQNVVETECGTWRQPQDGPACTDTLAYILGKTTAEPTEAYWWYRLGTVYHEQFSDAASALQHWDHSCSLGNAEACRVAQRSRDNM